MSPPPTVLYLDRFEGDLAALIWGERELRLPRALIPADAREGQMLRLTLTIDAELTRQSEQRSSARRANAAAQDDGGDIKL